MSYGVHIHWIVSPAGRRGSCKDIAASGGTRGCMAIDAFTVEWRHENLWLSPPINLIGPVVRRIIDEECHGTLVVPEWPVSMVVANADWSEGTASTCKELRLPAKNSRFVSGGYVQMELVWGPSSTMRGFGF